MEEREERPAKRRRISQSSEPDVVSHQMEDADVDTSQKDIFERENKYQNGTDELHKLNAVHGRHGEQEEPVHEKEDCQDNMGVDEVDEPLHDQLRNDYDLQHVLRDFADIEPEISEQPAMSKSKMKKLKRQQEWEASRADRKAKRKQKIQEKKERKRAVRDTAVDADSTDSHTVQGDSIPVQPKKRIHLYPVQLPVTFIFDCSFDDLMLDKERISLGSQLTRSYSDNSKAPFKVHMAVSSFTGFLKERFDTVLSGHHHQWKGVRFFDEHFVDVAEKAKEWMAGNRGGRLEGAFKPTIDSQSTPFESSEPAEDIGEIIYLTSDSPNTLTRLSPYTTYIIGGLVDRNRHKGICYKRALEHRVKTAKLPIGEYMDMTSRFVLATNHVSEIMLRWLEYGDWGEAFLKVMPKRKGGALKNLEVKESSKRTASKEIAEESLDDDLVNVNEASASIRGTKHGDPVSPRAQQYIPISGHNDENEDCPDEGRVDFSGAELPKEASVTTEVASTNEAIQKGA